MVGHMTKANKMAGLGLWNIWWIRFVSQKERVMRVKDFNATKIDLEELEK